MSTEQNLRELKNQVEIVGTLKSKNLEAKISQNNNPYIHGELIVETEFDGKVHNQKIKVMVMETSKLHKGVETVMKEYKTIDADGRENADRVRITGNLTLNEYHNRDGKLLSYNEIKGVFFNRLDDNTDQADKAIASIETVVQKFEEILDKDQLPTGDYSIKGFTVGWGSDVVELRNTLVKEDLAQAFMDLYAPGSTGRLTFKLNNYAEKIEQEEKPAAAVSHGFGSTETVEDTVIEKRISNLEITGGDVPMFGSKEYTPEEIEKAEKVRKLKLQELSNAADDTPPQTNTGFGRQSDEKSIDDNMPSGMGADDMPNF